MYLWVESQTEIADVSYPLDSASAIEPDCRLAQVCAVCLAPPACHWYGFTDSTTGWY